MQMDARKLLGRSITDSKADIDGERRQTTLDFVH